MSSIYKRWSFVEPTFVKESTESEEEEQQILQATSFSVSDRSPFSPITLKTSDSTRKLKDCFKKTFSPHQSVPITATMKWQFKEENALNNRQAESAKIRSKYPERIPVIVEKVPNTTIPDIDKKKFLVPNDISVAQFMWIIRKRIQLPSERAIFLFVGKILPQSSASMGQIYQEHRDEDGFLYIAYSGENSFGASLVETS